MKYRWEKTCYLGFALNTAKSKRIVVKMQMWQKHGVFSCHNLKMHSTKTRGQTTEIKMHDLGNSGSSSRGQLHCRANRPAGSGCNRGSRALGGTEPGNKGIWYITWRCRTHSEEIFNFLEGIGINLWLVHKQLSKYEEGNVIVVLCASCLWIVLKVCKTDHQIWRQEHKGWEVREKAGMWGRHSESAESSSSRRSQWRIPESEKPSSGRTTQLTNTRKTRS